MNRWYYNLWFIIGLIVFGAITITSGFGVLIFLAGIALLFVRIDMVKRLKKSAVESEDPAILKAEEPPVPTAIILTPETPATLIPVSQEFVAPSLSTAAEPPSIDTCATNDSSERRMVISRTIGDYRIKYDYEKNVAIFDDQLPDFSKIELYDELSFALDPENPTDLKSVKIFCRDIFIGYVYSDRVRDMITDWLRREEPIFSAVKSIDPNEKRISYYIAFYKNPFLGIDSYEQFVTKLIKSSKKVDDYYEQYNRQEMCEYIERGDELNLVYDDESSTFIAKDKDGHEVGEVNKSISKKILAKYDTDEPICLVDEVFVNENLKYEVNVLIYLK